MEMWVKLASPYYTSMFIYLSSNYWALASQHYAKNCEKGKNNLGVYPNKQK